MAARAMVRTTGLTRGFAILAVVVPVLAVVVVVIRPCPAVAMPDISRAIIVVTIGSLAHRRPVAVVTIALFVSVLPVARSVLSMRKRGRCRQKGGDKGQFPEHGWFPCVMAA